MALARVYDGSDDLDVYQFEAMPRVGDTIQIPVHGSLVRFLVGTVIHPGVFFGSGVDSQGLKVRDINTPRPPILLCSYESTVGSTSEGEQNYQTALRARSAEPRG